MRAIPGFTSLCLALTAAAASAEQRVLCTDDLSPGTPATFQGGFAVGEEAAVRFSPPPGAQLVGALVVWGGSDTEGTASTEGLRVYDDDGEDAFGGTGYPGTVRYDGDAGLVDSNSDASEVALDAPVALDGEFWLSVVFRHEGFPGVARDDGYDAASAIRGNVSGLDGWFDNEFVQVDGDWVIRAIVETDAPIDDTACRFVPAVGEGEGEGEEGEGDVGEGEGEGESAGEGEGDGGEGEADALFVSSITPSSASFGAVVDVAVLGGGFDDAVAVRIGSEVLDAVVVDGAGALRARTRGTLPVGAHDVIVQRGATLFTFPSGFTVTPIDDAGDGDDDAPEGCAAAGAPALFVLVLLRRRR